MQRIEFEDKDRDTLVVQDATEADYPHGLYVEVNGNEAVYLTRRQALEVYEALGDHLAATALDADENTCGNPLCCQQADPAESVADYIVRSSAEAEQPQTILEEAQDAVYGDRQQDYGHPREDFTRTAIIWTGLLQPLLADGAYIDAADVARCQIGVKLARDVHAPKRDNRVDMAGYALTLDRLETGR